MSPAVYAFHIPLKYNSLSFVRNHNTPTPRAFVRSASPLVGYKLKPCAPVLVLKHLQPLTPGLSTSFSPGWREESLL